MDYIITLLCAIGSWITSMSWPMTSMALGSSRLGRTAPCTKDPLTRDLTSISMWYVILHTHDQSESSWILSCCKCYFPIQDYAVNYWKSNGAPAEKLLVGFPTYGHTFKLDSSSNTGVGAPSAGPGPAGPYTRQSGFWAYYEVRLLDTSVSCDASFSLKNHLLFLC